MSTTTEAPVCPPISWADLDTDETAIMRVLQHRLGESMALQLPEAAARADLGTRQAQRAVKRLIEKHHIPIGSRTDEPAGWFVCVSADELLAVRNRLVRRALSTLDRARAFDPKLNDKLAEHFMGQQALFPVEVADETS